MQDRNSIHLETRERVYRAWLNSVELSKTYRAYASDAGNHERISKMFADYAEDEAARAERLMELLRELDR